MGALILPSRFTQQPQVAAPLDSRYPVAFAVNPAVGLIDLTQGSQVTTVGTIPRAATSNGVGASLYSTANYLSVTRKTAPMFQGPFTFLYSFRQTGAISNGGSMLLLGGQGVANAIKIYTITGGNSVLAEIYDTAGVRSLVYSGNIAVGSINNLALVYDPVAATAQWWNNGKPFTGAGGTGIGARTSGEGPTFEIGGSSAGSPPNHDVSLVAVVRAVLPAAVLANPWQLFPALPRRLWVASSTNDTALTGAVAVQATMAGALSTSIRLTAGAGAGATAVGDLSTSIRLAASAAAVASATGSLTTSIPLAASTSAQASTSGTLTTAIALAAGAVAGASMSATLSSGAAQLAAAAVAQASCTAALTTTIPLSASIQTNASASATLAGGVAQLSATLGASTSMSAQITTQVRLSATVTASASMSATFAGAGAQLSATMTSSASASAVLTTAIALAGAAIAQASASATLAGQGAALVANMSARVSASGALTTGVSLAAAARAVASGQATLATQIALVAIVQAQTTAAAQLASTSVLPNDRRTYVGKRRIRLYSP